MTSDNQHQAVQFAGLVEEARDRLTLEEQTLRDTTTLPPITPRIVTSDQHCHIRLVTGEPRDSDTSTRLLVVGAFILAVSSTVLALKARRDDNFWVGFTALIGWLTFVLAWMQYHFIRAEIEFDVDDAGFTLSRHVFGRRWSTRYNKRDIAYIHVGISRLALSDEGTVFDLLLYLRPQASTNMARGSDHDKVVLVESRHLDDLHWVGAALRRRLSVEMPPADHWVKPVQRRWPASVIRKATARA